ncbi:MAG TPA: zinc ABC transporter substrate-binding protein [Adhaeribacter sp.]|nr:zinc ABC transporter substrate-binding protein [Adhaeribacter sp.]
MENTKEADLSNRKLKIVTTTGILADAVQNITQDLAEVEALMGSGVDPHLYKATQGDLKKLQEADMIIYNGLHLEGKMGEVLEKLAKRKNVIAAADGLEETQLRKALEFSTTYDPHIWFDVALWKKSVEFISQKIQEKDPKNQAAYEKNTAKYVQELYLLNTWVIKEIASVPEQQRTLVTAHDAFGYFGRAYKIEVKGLQGISTVSEFGLRDVSELVNMIVENKIKAVFVESSVSPKAIEAVVAGCRDKGHEINIGGTLYSDALGAEGTEAGTYIGMVRHNVQTIVKALK